MHYYFSPTTYAALGGHAENGSVSGDTFITYQKELHNGIPVLATLDETEIRSGVTSSHRRTEYTHVEFIDIPAEYFSLATLIPLGVQGMPTTEPATTSQTTGHTP